jgi:hypothetical protein
LKKISNLLKPVSVQGSWVLTLHMYKADGHVYVRLASLVNNVQSENNEVPPDLLWAQSTYCTRHGQYIAFPLTNRGHRIHSAFSQSTYIFFSYSS